MILYNTLTRQKEELKPLEDGKVKIYTCGLTVYSQPHIGNWVSYIYWDVLVRALQAEGYDVERTQNITDVGHLTSDDDSGEDKLEKGAKREGVTAWQVADKYIKIANEEAEMLGLLKPTHLPRATAYIDQQITFVKDLESKGFTYVIPGDGVYFDTNKLKDYGKLARLDIEGLKPGARVPIDGKRNITDFAVWKFSHKGEKRDMEWESPWGVGFPGWHIECSAMSTCCLGDTFDIHGGGADLTFPHHENEIAQSEGATGKPFVRYWLHNGFVRINDEKMSKSLGNFFTVREILKHYQAEEIRYFIVSSHYRSPLNYDEEHLQNARAALTRFYTALRGLPISDGAGAEAWLERFSLAMDDDFNTPEALAVLFDLTREINRARRDGEEQATHLAAALIRMGGVLGILQDDPESYLRGSAPDQQGLSDQAIDALIQQRLEARSSKNWAEADRIRDQLKAGNVLLEDGPQGTSWRRA